MEVDRFDHINFVTKDAEKITSAFAQMTGKRPMFIRDNSETDGVKENVFIFPYGFRVQEVTDEEKPLGAMLGGMDDGIYAIAMYCKNLDQSVAEMEKLGYKKLRDGLALTEGARFATFDTMEDIGFNIELWQDVDMYDYGHDDTDVVE